MTLTIEGDTIKVPLHRHIASRRGAITQPSRSPNRWRTPRFADAAAQNPNNGGLFRPITVTAPPGTIVHALPPAAVAARGLAAFRMGNTLLGALAQALLSERRRWRGRQQRYLDRRLRSGSQSVHLRRVRLWLLGPRAGQDGIDGITNIFSDLSNNPVEVIEAEHPLRIEAYELIPDSGGAGKFRGGMGVRKRITFPRGRSGAAGAERSHAHPPYGLDGGLPGAPPRNMIVRDGTELARPQSSRMDKQGDTLDHFQAGGGGFGHPLEREPQAGLDNVRDGLVSDSALS